MLEEDYPQARVAYLAAAEAMGDARRALLDEADAVTYFTESRLDAPGMLVRLSLHLRDRAGALEWADAARGQELVRRLAWTTLPAPPGAPETVLAEEAETRRLLRAQEADLRVGGSADAALLTDYRRTMSRLHRLEDRLAELAPEYVSMRRGERLGWNAVTALLTSAPSPDGPEGTDAMARLVLAEYHVTDHETFVFGVTADAPEPEVVTVDVTRAELRELAEAAGDTLARDRAASARTWRTSDWYGCSPRWRGGPSRGTWSTWCPMTRCTCCPCRPCPSRASR